MTHLNSSGRAPQSCPHVQVVMEILAFFFSIFVLLPAGGVGVCSVTVNAVSEKSWGDLFILNATVYC